MGRFGGVRTGIGPCRSRAFRLIPARYAPKTIRVLAAGAALIEQRDPLGNTTLYEYDEAFNRTAVTDPRGNTTTMTYDAAGNLLSSTAPAPLSYVAEFTYNAFGDVSQVRRVAPTRHLALVVTMAALVITMSGCDTFTTFDRLGVSMGADGTIEIHYLACDYESLTAVSLVNSHDDPGDEDDEVLWEIRSDSGDDGGGFAAGSRPEGFVEAVEFGGTYPADDILVVVIELETSVGAALDFAMADLEVGSVWTTGKPNANVDPVTFQEQARASCEPPGGPSAAP